jgi:hypothetical protein
VGACDLPGLIVSSRLTISAKRCAHAACLHHQLAALAQSNLVQENVDERNEIRDEHRAKMLERAKQRQQTIDEKQDDTVSIPDAISPHLPGPSGRARWV